MGNNLTADGSAANATFILGLAISSSSRAAATIQGVDAVDPTDATRTITNAKCYVYNNSSDSVIIDADVVSMDADGFTINITTTNGTAHIVNYVALGGSDITNVAIKEFTTKTSTGSQAYTGVGFKPDMLFVMSSSATSSPLSNGTGMLGIGFGTGASNRGAVGLRIGSGVSTQIDEKTQKTDKIIDVTNGGASFLSADLTSLDNDGFTLNYTTASGTTRYAYALCIKGGRFKVASFNQPTSTGSQAITGVGFSPSAVILASWNSATSSSIVSDQKLSIGAGTSSSSRFGLWEGDQNGTVGAQQSNSNLDRTKILKMMAHANSPTIDAAADLTSLDSDGFTLNWSTADATAREILYLAMGSAASGRLSRSPALAGLGGAGQEVFNPSLDGI